MIVTIAGNGGMANIYTNIANYSAPLAETASTTGTFAGNGAHHPLPLASAPPFNNSPTSSSSTSSTTASNQTSSGGNASSSSKATTVASAQSTRNTINVSNSGQLLSLLNASTPGPGGKINVPSQATRSRTSTAANQTQQLALPGGRKNVPISGGARQFPVTMPISPGTQ